MIHSFFVFILQLVRSSSFPSFPSSHCRDFSSSALNLVLSCRCPNVLNYDENWLHELAKKVGFEGSNSELAEMHILSVVEIKYVDYLQRLRAATIGEQNLGKVVQAIAQYRAIQYKKHPRTLQMISIIKDSMLKCNVNIPDVTYGGDLVLQEFYSSSKMALETYFFAFYEYNKFIRFPFTIMNLSMSNRLDAVQRFVASTFAKFDIRATYPDAIMCLTYLQYLKYMSLIEYELVYVQSAEAQYNAVLTTLKNMQIPQKYKKY